MLHRMPILYGLTRAPAHLLLHPVPVQIPRYPPASLFLTLYHLMPAQWSLIALFWSCDRIAPGWCVPYVPAPQPAVTGA